MKRIISLFLVLLLVLVCIAVPTLAEEPTSHVTESSGNGYALYNGVKLPNIDTVWTDKETYPYGYIMQADASNIYPTLSGTVSAFNITSIPAHVSDDGDVVVESGITFQYQAWYYANSQEIIDWFISIGMSSAVVGEWFLVEDVTDMDGSLSVSPVVWTSHDILNSDGTTYLVASSPIPLDGMTVIEWDGVTDGLESVPLSSSMTLYRVADYEAANNAVCVSFDVSYNDLQVLDSFNQGEYGSWHLNGVSVAAIPENTDGSTSGIFFLVTFGEDSDHTYTSLLAYTPAGSEPDTPVPDLEAPAVAWGFTDRELIVSEYHPIVAISDIGADGQCVLYSRSLNSDGTASEWTPYITDEVVKDDSGIDMCAFDLYPDESKVPYSMQYKAVVTLGSGTNTVTVETDVLTIHWVRSSTVDPTEPTIDGGGSSGDVDSDDDVPMLQAIWQAITDGFNNLGVWFSAQFNAINTWGQDIVDAINNGFGSMNDLESNVDEFQESVNQQGSQMEDMAEAMGAVTRPDVSTAIPDISGYLTVTGPVTLAAVFDPFWKNSYILRLLLASLAVSVAFTVVYGGKK